MSKKARTSPKLGGKPSEEKARHSGSALKSKIEPLAEKKRRASAGESDFDPLKYVKRLDDVETSIKELQDSIVLLKREQEKTVIHAEIPNLEEKPSAGLREEDQISIIEPPQLEELRRQEGTLNSRIESLKTELGESQKKIDALHEYYISQNQALDREFQARQLTIHQRADEERTKADAEIAFLSKQRVSLQEEIRALVNEKQALSKEVALGRSLSMILKNPDAISAADINLLIEKFVEARDTRASGAKYLSNINTREARRSLISSIMKIGKQASNS